jgi:hypothetical protein
MKVAVYRPIAAANLLKKKNWRGEGRYAAPEDPTALSPQQREVKRRNCPANETGFCDCTVLKRRQSL